VLLLGGLNELGNQISNVTVRARSRVDAVVFAAVFFDVSRV
jgi:hypothetical protein